MKKINIHEAKTHLSAVLANLRPNGKVLICRRNTPIAEIRALPVSPRKRRPFGLDSGKLTVPPSFFEPLSEDIIESFEGASAR
jgi:antitoxin (DNA-binding transcriptional repressor) of toxin-antitoxin stability system